MATQTPGILAVFKYLDHFTDAIEKIRERGDFQGHEYFSPTSYHEIEHACHYKPSGVRWFTFTGAMIGTITGFSLALGLDYLWPLTVGGKQAGIASIPAYVVIGFELTILFGALATILGMLVLGRLANPKARILDARLTDDRFGVFVPNVGSSSPQAAFLKECGAEEIKTV